MLALGLLLPLAGCGDVDTEYGKVQGESINGVGSLANLIKLRGHSIRSSTRYNERVSNWADVIIRVSPFAGEIDDEEAEWLSGWLRNESNRMLVYVVKDYTSDQEFWASMIANLPSSTPQDQRDEMQRRLNESSWRSGLRGRPRRTAPGQTADAKEWFSLSDPTGNKTTSKKLEGPWAEGVNAEQAAVPFDQYFDVLGGEKVYLEADGKPLVIGWSLSNQSQVIVVANASFILNASLLNKARRPLTEKLVDQLGPPPRRVAIVEGYRPTDDSPVESSSPFALLKTPPFGWIASHFSVFLILLALASAVRLGRVRSEPPTGVERPVAHPEALGRLLAKSGRSDVALLILKNYRRWRHPNSSMLVPSPSNRSDSLTPNKRRANGK